MEGFVSGILWSLKDRSVILSIFFGCVFIILLSGLFKEFGFVKPLGTYKMVPIYIVYFIIGSLIANGTLKLFIWTDEYNRNEKFIERMKNEATNEEKAILQVLLTNRTITLQKIAELQYGTTLDQIILADQYALINIASTLQLLVDSGVVIEKDISPNQGGGLKMYYLSKDYLTLLKKNPNLTK